MISCSFEHNSHTHQCSIFIVELHMTYLDILPQIFYRFFPFIAKVRLYYMTQIRFPLFAHTKAFKLRKKDLESITWYSVNIVQRLIFNALFKNVLFKSILLSIE